MSVFHVKHRVHGMLAAAAMSLLLVSCTGGSPPTGWMPPAKLGELVVVQEGSGDLVALNPRDGATVWRFEHEAYTRKTNFLERFYRPVGSPILYGSPVAEGTALYFVTYGGIATRLDPLTNVTPVWRVELDHKVVAAPLVRGDRLYVFTEDGTVLFLDARNGNVVSEHRPIEGRVWGAPVMRDSTIYIAADSGELVAMSADTGTVEWKQQLAATAADLAIVGGTLYVGSFDRTLHAIDVTRQSVALWRFQGDGWFVGPPGTDGRTIYAATLRGSVYAIDATGKELWHFSHPEDEYRATPQLLGGTLVVASRSGAITGLDPATGVERWRQQATSDGRLEANGLVVDASLLYVSTKRTVYRVDPVSGTVAPLSTQQRQASRRD